MVAITEYSRESHAFDAELTDWKGEKLPVDCKVYLPSVWGKKVRIKFSLPHSAMPLNRIENPCSLDVECRYSGARLVLKDIWYRQLPVSIHPPRSMGASEILITHIGSLRLVHRIKTPSHKLLVYISGSGFFNDFSLASNGNSLRDDLLTLAHPKIGFIKLQRYWVKSLLTGSESFLLSSGYQLEIQLDGAEISSDEVLEHLDPLLNILSIFLRQRILIYGWELLEGDARTRYWKDPLDPIQTCFVGVEPKYCLASISKFQEKINCAIENHCHLTGESQKSILNLSYSLCPAMKLSDAERFMAMYRDLETMANKLYPEKQLTIGDRLLIDRLQELADSFRSENSELCKRVEGIVRSISQPHMTDRLKYLLEQKGVHYSDLWSIDGKKGLSGIRNKLTHGGNVKVHHQGLAVSVLHLSLITERFVFALLGLSLEPHIYEKFRRDEWLQPYYFKSLKENIFNVDFV